MTLGMRFIPAHGHEYRLCILGPCQVGKSSLVSRFMRHGFLDESRYSPTIEDVYRQHLNVEGENCLLEITDTSGDQNFFYITEQQILKGDGFLCIFSIDDLNSFNEVKDFVEKIKLIKQDSPCVLVGTKCDKARKVDKDLAESMAASYNIP